MSNVYITKALRKDIPSDAILLSRQEALSMHWETIRNWNSRTEVWPFVYGIGLLAGLNAATAVSITNYYRSKLKLGGYGRVTMTIPTVVLPVFTSLASHITMVTNPIMLGEGGCPLCIQTRAALLQISLGVLYPVIVSPFAGFYYATSYGTYDIPPIKIKNFYEIVDLWLKLSKRFVRTKLPIALAVNGFTASALAYFEADSFYNIQRKIIQREEEFRQFRKGWNHS